LQTLQEDSIVVLDVCNTTVPKEIFVFPGLYPIIFVEKLWSHYVLTWAAGVIKIRRSKKIKQSIICH